MPPWAPLNAAPTSRLLAGPAGTPGFPSLAALLAGAHAPRQGTALGPRHRGVSRALEYKLPLPARLRAGGPGSEWAAPSSAGPGPRAPARFVN